MIRVIDFRYTTESINFSLSRIDSVNDKVFLKTNNTFVLENKYSSVVKTGIGKYSKYSYLVVSYGDLKFSIREDGIVSGTRVGYGFFNGKLGYDLQYDTSEYSESNVFFYCGSNDLYITPTPTVTSTPRQTPTVTSTPESTPRETVTPSVTPSETPNWTSRVASISECSSSIRSYIGINVPPTAIVGDIVVYDDGINGSDCYTVDQLLSYSLSSIQAPFTKWGDCATCKSNV